MTFDTIQVGDQVITPPPNSILATVERVTKTQFTANGTRYTKSQGQEVGTSSDVWHTAWCRKATPVAIEEFKIANEHEIAEITALRRFGSLRNLFQQRHTTAELLAVIPHLTAAIEALTPQTTTHLTLL